VLKLATYKKYNLYKNGNTLTKRGGVIMKRNRRMRAFNEKEESNKLIYISLSVVIIAILTFAITYVIYSNVLNQKTEVADSGKKITELSSTSQTEETSEVINPIGKDISEVQEEETKIAINTTNIEKQTETVNVTKEDNTTIAEKTTTEKIEENKEPSFIKPVEGEIIKEFANENLVYSQTLKEWVTHNGIDIEAEKTTIVKSAEDGTVKSIKNDPRYGTTVVIEHTNGYVTVYSNLLTAEFVKEDETVEKGQTIGTVGNTAVFEIADESHLHFEILKDNVYLNPSDILN
jgi:murein DD-endopeptidase MepM/ murein hydrolase activator NlpD